jgi:hypothetical protein
MALITSAASGNFSAGATWTGGVVPGVGDEARASTGHTVTIDVNTTCDEVSNAGTGKFVLADGVTLTANVTAKGTAVCLEFTAASPAGAFIVGNVSGSTLATGIGITNTLSGTLTITGNVISGTTTNVHGILNNSSGIINVTGNVTPSATAGGNPTPNAIQNAATGTINVTGAVSGGGGTGIGAGMRGIQNNSTGTVVVVGACNAGAGAGTTPAAIFNNSTGAVTVTGDCTATNQSNAIQSTGIAVIKVSGSMISSPNGNVAVNTPRLLVDPTPSSATVRFAKNGTTTYSDFFTADNSLGQAAPADVRSGTVYADGNLTGTCAVPAAASVAFGVPVDATTGTAALEPSDIAAAVWDRVLTGATHNIPSSAGRRLRILDDERIITDGQVVSATTNTVTLQPIGSLCVGQTIVVTSDDTGEKQTRFILAYDSATNTASVDTQWCNIPQAGDEYLLTTVRDPLITRNDHPAGTVGAEIDEMYLIHGLKDGETLTVTPTSRTAGAIAQTIGGDGTTTTTVSRD